MHADNPLYLADVKRRQNTTSIIYMKAIFLFILIWISCTCFSQGKYLFLQIQSFGENKTFLIPEYYGATQGLPDSIFYDISIFGKGSKENEKKHPGKEYKTISHAMNAVWNAGYEFISFAPPSYFIFKKRE